MKEQLEISLTKMKSTISEIVKDIEIKVDEGLCPYANNKNICTKTQVECKSRFYQSGVPYCRYNIKNRN